MMINERALTKEHWDAVAHLFDTESQELLKDAGRYVSFCEGQQDSEATCVTILKMELAARMTQAETGKATIGSRMLIYFGYLLAKCQYEMEETSDVRRD